MTRPRYIVAQVGARRAYAVPAILASAGMLERFYTDLCGNVGLGRLLAMAGQGSTALARLAGRQVPDSIAPLTRTHPLRTAAHECRKRLGYARPGGSFRGELAWQCALGRAMAREMMGDATHLFSMFGEFPPLLMEAKARGLRIVSEVYLLLATDRIMEGERREFPAWESDLYKEDTSHEESLCASVMLSHSDLFLCPSAAVRDDLIDGRGVKAESAVVVPYGVDPRWLELEPHPQRGRVLFTGAAQLRKGIHYLAMAAQDLVSRIPGIEFRVAGNVSSRVAAQPICRSLNFLGRIPRERIHEEFQTADVFVLPSLAEGSAEVTYEALAAGLPVITTRAAGSVVRDGIEGRIVPERNPAALASAIEELVTDREMRDRMATAARQRAREFTWSRYGQRLLQVLEQFHGGQGCLLPAGPIEGPQRAARVQ